jgi:glycosyltransferase involved in cell wall biosynthesis
LNKKILISINTSWNIINFRVGLLQALQKEGYKIIVLAPKDSYSELFKDYHFEYHDIVMNNKGTNPIEDLKLTISYYKILKKIKPDLMLNYTIKPNIYGTIAANLLNIPTINNIAGLGTLFVNENFITKIAKYLYKYSQDKASKVFFQNNEDFELFTSSGLVYINKSDVLPGSGVNTEIFKPIEKTKNLGKVVFLLISRMLWDKGVGEYVEAARILTKKYPNVEFQLLGFLDVVNNSAISKEQMDTWLNEGIINYLGTSDNVKNEISNADCMVLPSFYREGTPRTLLESASMAKPIVTTENIGCKDVVNDEESGYLCRIKDATDLASKLELIINMSEEERKAMGQKGREKIKKEFDEKIVIDKYLDAVKQIF